MRWLALFLIGSLSVGCSEEGGGVDAVSGFGGPIPAPGANPACQASATSASQAVGAAVESADRSCESVDDCLMISIDTDCHAACGALVSAAGAESVAAVVAEQNDTTCEGFLADGCSPIVPPCVPPLPPACVAGRCTQLEVDPGTTPSQQPDAGSDEDGGTPVPGDGDGDGDGAACIDRTVEFGSDGGFVAFVERYTLAPCARFTLERTAFGDPGSDGACDNRVAADATVSALDVMIALDHPDVQNALAVAPVLYGRDTRPVDGTVFQVEVDGARVELGWDCMGTPGCDPVPAGLARLEGLLQDLITQQRSLPPCDAL